MITNLLEYCLFICFHNVFDPRTCFRLLKVLYFGEDMAEYCQSEESLGYLSYQDWGREFESSSNYVHIDHIDWFIHSSVRQVLCTLCQTNNGDNEINSQLQWPEQWKHGVLWSSGGSWKGHRILKLCDACFGSGIMWRKYSGKEWGKGKRTNSLWARSKKESMVHLEKGSGSLWAGFEGWH